MATLENPYGGYRPGSNPGSSHPDAQASNRNTDNVESFAQQAKEQVRHLADEAKEETSRVASQAGDMVQGLIGKQKDQAVEKLDGVAGALREVGNRLQQEDGAGFGRYAVRAADQVGRFSGYLQDRDLKTFVRDTEGFARRHPDVFLGGTFIAGLLLARFLKSSSSNLDDSGNGSSYGANYGANNGDNYQGNYAPERRNGGGAPYGGVNPQAYASLPGERFGRGAELGGLPEPSRSVDRTGPYGSTTGVRYPDTPEGA